jgi:hypothetical protein
MCLNRHLSRVVPPSQNRGVMYEIGTTFRTEVASFHIGEIKPNIQRRPLITNCRTTILAECTSGSSTSDNKTFAERIPTRTEVPMMSKPSTDSPTPTARSPTSIKESLLEVLFGDRLVEEYLRYFDESSDPLKKLHPECDWWIEATVPLGSNR